MIDAKTLRCSEAPQLISLYRKVPAYLHHNLHVQLQEPTQSQTFTHSHTNTCLNVSVRAWSVNKKGMQCPHTPPPPSLSLRWHKSMCHLSAPFSMQWMPTGYHPHIKFIVHSLFKHLSSIVFPTAIRSNGQHHPEEQTGLFLLLLL